MKNKNIGILLVTFLITGCTSLSPSPYKDTFLKPVKTYNERPEITQTPHFNPQKIEKIVVAVEDKNIRQFKQGNIFYLLETEAMSALLRKGYMVISRTDEIARKKEIGIQSQQKTRGAAADQMADTAPAQLIINISKVITEKVIDKEKGNMIFYNNHVSISARLINLQSSQLLWTGTINKSQWIKKGLEIDSIQQALKKLMNEFPDTKS